MDMRKFKRGDEPWEKQGEEPIMQQAISTVLQRTEFCGDHSAHEIRLQRNEKDVNDLWEAIKMIRSDIQSLFVKFGWIYGGLTVANIITVIAVQIISK
jgi:hypothetical protein